MNEVNKERRSWFFLKGDDMFKIIENFLKKYSNNKNILVIGSQNKLHQKFVNTMELIIKAINDKYEFEIKSK